jgi:hypothetical protein
MIFWIKLVIRVLTKEMNIKGAAVFKSRALNTGNGSVHSTE